MCDGCDWAEVLSGIEEMLNDENEKYMFAEDTLSGIYDWIAENEHVTEGQQLAVDNIKNSKE